MSALRCSSLWTTEEEDHRGVANGPRAAGSGSFDLLGWNDTPTWRTRPWYTRKRTPSFLDALTELRRTAPRLRKFTRLVSE